MDGLLNLLVHDPWTGIVLIVMGVLIWRIQMRR